MNFLELYEMEDTSLCDRVIEYFSSKEKVPGKVNVGKDSISTVMPDIKNSEEVSFTIDDAIDNVVLTEYLNTIQSFCEKYSKKFEFCNANSPWTIFEQVNIQHYKPNGGFYQWHCERNSSSWPNSARHLVFMTYLNDVTDGGETEWFYQKLKIQPKKGMTAIWPVDWTYTHRGIPSPSQDKYVVTGWYSYS